MNDTISAEELRQLLDYNPSTGIFIWKPRSGVKWFNSRFAGKEAGSILSNSYSSINVGGKNYLVHRLAWLYHHGEWPKHQIDHLDRNPANNAIDNLTDATPAQNNANKRMRIGRSGRKGVQPSYGTKWIATAEYKGKRIHFGTFSSIEEAAAAYEAGILNIEDHYQRRQHLADRKPITKPTEPLTHEELLAHLYYDPLTGKFFRKIRDKLCKTEAGYVETGGYRRVRAGGRRVPAHVLAVFYMTGKWPDGIVDHINNVRNDNRWANLRVVDRSQNAFNRARSNTKVRGVRATRNKIKRWEAAITIRGKRCQIGTYDTEQDAIAAWTAFVQQAGLESYIPKYDHAAP